MKNKPFQCNECGKKLTFGEAKAAEFRGCPKCGGSDIDENNDVGNFAGMSTSQATDPSTGYRFAY